MNPLVSVIIPVYNVEKYLDDCLRGVVVQTLQEIEIILIDDGSSDRSGEMCDAWAAKDARIRVIHQENAGVSAARNTGLEVAQGEFVGFMDSDDVISPHMYEVMWSNVQAYSADLVVCDFVCYDDHLTYEQACEVLTEASRTSPKKDKRIWEAPGRNLLTTFSSGQYLYAVHHLPCVEMFRTEQIRKYQLTFQSFHDIGPEDYLFTLKYLLNCQRVVEINDVLYAYRQHHGSLSHTNASDWIERLERFSDSFWFTVAQQRDLKQNQAAMYALTLYLCKSAIIRNFRCGNKKTLYHQIAYMRKSNLFRTLVRGKYRSSQSFVTKLKLFLLFRLPCSWSTQLVWAAYKLRET